MSTFSAVKKIRSHCLAVVCFATGAWLGLAAHAEAPGPEAWPQWRGPTGNGVSLRAQPPVSWSETENIAWKRAIPGRGLGSPVVRAGRVYLTTAVPVGQRLNAEPTEIDGAHDNLIPDREMEFRVLAVDAATGDVVWSRTVARGRPHEGTHVTGSWASASAIVDESRVYASFGSMGIHALDLNGKPLWKLDLGDMHTRHGHGEGSSPVLWKETLVVNWDHQGESFVVALNAANGDVRWKVARDEITSWSTPLVVEHDGRPQVVVSATRRVTAYDLVDGRKLWECGGLSRNVVASPVAADGIVYAANSYDHRALLAIRLREAKGDITGSSAVVWRRDRDTPYVSSPVLSGGRLCFVKHNQALFTCVDKDDGRTLFGPERLPGLRDIFASPIAAGGHLYVVSRNGATFVLADADEFRPIAINRLEDSFSTTPAAVGGALFLRGDRHLYKIAKPTAAKKAPEG